MFISIDHFTFSTDKLLCIEAIENKIVKELVFVYQNQSISFLSDNPFELKKKIDNILNLKFEFSNIPL